MHLMVCRDTAVPTTTKKKRKRYVSFGSNNIDSYYVHKHTLLVELPVLYGLVSGRPTDTETKKKTQIEQQHPRLKKKAKKKKTNVLMKTKS